MKPEHYLAVFCIIVVGVCLFFANSAVEVGAGYSAKIVCSGTFTSGRDFDQVITDDIGLSVPIYSISKDENSVTSSTLFGMIKRTAVYNSERNSCTLLAPHTSTCIWDNHPNYKETNTNQSNENWPLGDKNSDDKANSNIDYNTLDKLMEASFHQPTLRETGFTRNTRGVIVIYDGKIIAEKYAEGITSSTPLLGWSMTKSIISTLIGFRIQENKLSLNDNNLLKEWENDKRSTITLDQLLRASSGLEFKETNDAFSDTSAMLFRSSDLVSFAAQKSFIHDPDTVWSYSSGTTNILSKILRESFKNDGGDEAYWNYPKKIFSKLGMNSMVLDTDNMGNFVGSSFSHATLRDWSRFGMFAYQNGNWMGEQLLNEKWWNYALTPSKTAPIGEYGAQWWLNAGNQNDSSDRLYPSIPSDTFLAQGYLGQYVAVIPSQKLVVVRLGSSSPATVWDMEGFLNFTINHVINN